MAFRVTENDMAPQGLNEYFDKKIIMIFLSAHFMYDYDATRACNVEQS
jgi:hypothetical protein